MKEISKILELLNINLKLKEVKKDRLWKEEILKKLNLSIIVHHHSYLGLGIGEDCCWCLYNNIIQGLIENIQNL